MPRSTPSPTPAILPAPGLHLIAIRSRRVRLMLHGSGWLMLGMGVPWAAGFAVQGLWLLAALELLLAAGGAWVLHCVRSDHLRVGTAVFVLTTLLFVCTVGLFVDVPDGIHPRSIHAFLLPLAFASYLVLQLEHRALYFGVPALCMLGFVVFASSTVGYPLYMLSDEHRTVSAWFCSFSAVVALFIAMVLMHADLRVRSALEAELQVGLENRQLEAHYQPQVDQHGQVIGAEALVRWRHPVRGLVPPAEFIPLAEQCGLISEVGRVVLTAACHQLADWAQRPERAHLTLSVNVSASQLLEPRFVENTLALLGQMGADPRKLKLELTETMLVHDIDKVVGRMAALRERGIGISLDDFGTGYSSLAYLKRLPLDQLKIDKSFVDNVLTAAHDAAIARTVVALGQSLGLQVIAEGVETEAQRDFLHGIGCKAYQGYLFSRPLPAAEFDAYLCQCDARVPAPALA
jgi:EAL domain-containing protein (putative c-di-GMP-specific phosphodiesterase class I)